jgi:transcriptional regulator with GAF, ATPase, and Fis domain
LDEVGELPADIQVKLLRVLQEGEFERVGSSETKHVDVRIIAATNRNMKDMVSRGDFRSDLYYRLNVFPIESPSLRQRKEDLPLLIDYLLNKLSLRLGKPFTGVSEASMQALMEYDWPGNIRELQNVLERAAIVSEPPLLQHVALAETRNFPDENSVGATSHLSLKELERQHILAVLQSVHGVISGKNGAAEILKLPPSTLRSKMKKLGI